jgi:hypothetical protein
MTLDAAFWPVQLICQIVRIVKIRDRDSTPTYHEITRNSLSRLQRNFCFAFCLHTLAENDTNTRFFQRRKSSNVKLLAKILKKC